MMCLWEEVHSGSPYYQYLGHTLQKILKSKIAVSNFIYFKFECTMSNYLTGKLDISGQKNPTSP